MKIFVLYVLVENLLPHISSTFTSGFFFNFGPEGGGDSKMAQKPGAAGNFFECFDTNTEEKRDLRLPSAGPKNVWVPGHRWDPPPWES